MYLFKFIVIQTFENSSPKKCHSHGLYQLCFCFKYDLKPYLVCEILLIPTFSKLFWIALFIENNFSFLLMLFLYWMIPLYKLWNRTVDCVVHLVFIHYIHRFNQSWSLNFNPNWKLNQPLARFCVESWQEPVHISQAQLVMKLLVCEILKFNIFFDAHK